ncbi:hypothetical protein ABMA27_003189 [Loxostege sticticalis]|uniref:Uncharacterized protein n=1 Tax=Loxostege sticticalis TaxID=481309 RepID=A0ABR3HSG4_LOXSC
MPLYAINSLGKKFCRIYECTATQFVNIIFPKTTFYRDHDARILKKTAIPTVNLPDLKKKDQETQTINVTPLCKSVQTEDTLSVLTHQISQTAASLSANSPRKRKLQSDLLESRTKLKLYDVGFQTQNAQIDTFHKLSDKFLTKELAMLVKAQTITLYFCLNLNYTSPQAYRLLQSALCMPCPSTLSKHYIPIKTDINEKVMLALKIKVENMSEQEKNCSVVLDAMSLT